jgi:predicted branched-subunit amino acid permease
LLAKLLRLALLPTLLPALLSSLSSWTAWSLVGRLTALLGLSLTALLPTGLAFVLLLALVLVLGIFPLRDDQAAICSADAVKCDA